MEAFHVEAVVYKQSQSLRADALVPVRTSHPVARLSIILTEADIALAVSVIAHTPNGLSRFLQDDGPGLVVIEHGADYLQALLHTLMWRPTGTWSHFRVAGVLVVVFRYGANLYGFIAILIILIELPDNSSQHKRC